MTRHYDFHDLAEASLELLAQRNDMLAVLKRARVCVPFPSDTHDLIVAAIERAEARKK